MSAACRYCPYVQAQAERVWISDGQRRRRVLRQPLWIIIRHERQTHRTELEVVRALNHRRQRNAARPLNRAAFEAPPAPFQPTGQEEQYPLGV